MNLQMKHHRVKQMTAEALVSLLHQAGLSKECGVDFPFNQIN